MLTLFTIKRDGKSKKRSFGLYGSAIGLVESNAVTGGNKNCFRVLDGLEPIILQAQSRDSMMEWSTSIAHSISMENGGGLLLDKEKRVLAKDGFGLDSAGFPTQCNITASSFLRRVKHETAAKSIVFSKPIPRTEHTSCSEINRLEPITEKIDKSKLDITYTTEQTEVASTTFNSLDPADISQSMEDFARNFFVLKENTISHMPNRKIPTQELRAEVSHPWLTIDRVESSTSSGSEIFDKVSDFDDSSHINPKDFDKLLQFTKDYTNVRL